IRQEGIEIDGVLELLLEYLGVLGIDVIGFDAVDLVGDFAAFAGDGDALALARQNDVLLVDRDAGLAVAAPHSRRPPTFRLLKDALPEDQLLARLHLLIEVRAIRANADEDIAVVLDLIGAGLPLAQVLELECVRFLVGCRTGDDDGKSNYEGSWTNE